MFGAKKKLKNREIADFCGHLQMLLTAGIPLLDALGILKNKQLKFNLDKVIQKVSEGEYLSQALPKNFPPLVISSVQNAEKAGNLEENLNQLNHYFEGRAESEEKIKSALVYPVFIILLSLISILVLFLFILPGFKNLFFELGVELPLLTRLIAKLVDLILNFWYLPIIFISILLLVLSRLRRTLKVQQRWDAWQLKIPLLGKFLIKEQIGLGFCSLGSLLKGGTPLVEALNIVADSVNNGIFKEIFFNLKEEIKNGEKFSVSLSRCPFFSRETIQMLTIAEKSGKLQDMLLSIADFYEQEREVFLKRFITLLEPSLTLMVGIFVAIIVLGMFLPLVNMISTLQ